MARLLYQKLSADTSQADLRIESKRMHIEDDLELDPDERRRLNERRQRLRASLPPLKKAAEGEEPLSNVMDLEQGEA